MQKICGDCQLFDKENSVCKIIILHEGEKYELPVLPHHPCHWEKVSYEINRELKFNIENTDEPYLKDKWLAETKQEIQVKQVGIWSDGKNGYIETTI